MIRAPRSGGEPEDHSVLERWSRRKHAATAAPSAEPADGLSEPGIDAVAAPVELTDADMPPLERLDGASDYSPFLSPGVSDALRRLALRKLFHSPAFNLRDGIDDYDDDYRVFTALGDVVTADMKHRLALHETLSAQTNADSAADSRPVDRQEDATDIETVAGVPARIDGDKIGDVEPPDADQDVT